MENARTEYEYEIKIHVRINPKPTGKPVELQRILESDKKLTELISVKNLRWSDDDQNISEMTLKQVLCRLIDTWSPNVLRPQGDGEVVAKDLCKIEKIEVIEKWNEPAKAAASVHPAA
jgi:hypothetical protein